DAARPGPGHLCGRAYKVELFFDDPGVTTGEWPRLHPAWRMWRARLSEHPLAAVDVDDRTGDGR
ncbi:hypothetical protein, partial [Mycobacterium sp.]|uniref:hypothetical protein n=1 Tax=Mycobacterium sp. TaxID=1785 RepID=UPI003F96951A